MAANPLLRTTLSALLLAGCIAMGQAQVTVIEDGPFSAMLDAYAQRNQGAEDLVGYRIQILATTDRLRLEEAEAEFARLFPQYPSAWVHEQPYYKLRTGAFLTKDRALEMLYRLKQSFPSAYPAQVRDIKSEELVYYY